MKYKLLNKEEYMKCLPQIRNLFEKSFNKSIDEKYLIWRYVENLKDDLLVCVAIYDNKIVGNYSVFPCDLVIDGNKIKSALSMTTMTDPEFSGKGIFTKLAEKLYFEIKKRGYKVVFGFPNNNSHRIFKRRLLWKDIYELPTMSLENDYIKNIDNVHKNNDFFIMEDNEFKLDYDELFNLNSNIKVYKNKEYLKWRFSNNPVNRYTNYVIQKDNKIMCNCVIKFFQNQMDIVEINSMDYDYFKILLKEVILINKEKITRVNTWIMMESSVRNIYEKIGFINTSPITYFGVKVLDDMIDTSIYNWSNWSIQMGDSDVY